MQLLNGYVYFLIDGCTLENARVLSLTMDVPIVCFSDRLACLAIDYSSAYSTLR